jgi:hypothetical protein
MESLIRQAFVHVEIYGPHVMEGQYDLIGPDGEIILPSVWDKVAQPGMLVSMVMWPIEDLPPPRPTTPPLPAGWEITSGPSGMKYFVNNDTLTSHWNLPDDSSHRSPGTSAVPPSPIPSTPHSTTPDQVPTPRREFNTRTGSKRSRGCEIGDARNS